VRRLTMIGLITLLCGLTAPVGADEIYGEIRLHDIDSGRTRIVGRDCKIVVRTDHQVIRTISRNGKYQVYISELGQWPLTLHYRGLELGVEIGSFETPNRYDLIIETVGDEARLRAEQRQEHLPRLDEDG